MKRNNGWIKVLLSGALLYFISLFILILTRNPNLFPTVVLIGNFLVPVTYVAFLYDRRHLSRLSMPTTAYTFLYGGLLGILATALFEPFFVRSLDPLSVIKVGVIEEAAKILGVWVIARRLKPYLELDGLILGAAAGMGFAALESIGYAFTAFLLSRGSLSVPVSVTLIRGILAPFGHGTWTAILSSVLFHESDGKRFRLTIKVILAFLSVALLHALWDGLPPIVAYITSSGSSVIIAQLSIGIIGFFILWLRWRTAKRQQIEQLKKLELGTPTPQVQLGGK